jgi:opacity family porin
MSIYLNKILKILLISATSFAALNSYAQREEITIKYDTIITPQKRILKLVKVRTLPKFILHLNFSYDDGALELTSHNGAFIREDFITGKNFGARHGFGANLIGKLPLSKKGDFWLDIVTGYDRFQSNLFVANTQEGRVTYNSISGGVGLEYDFTATHKVKYFFGLNPLVSAIFGKSSLINPDNNQIDIKITTSMRIGYSAFIGFEYQFEKNLGVNLGIKFTHANLLLKKTELPVQETEATATVGLNDENPPDETYQFAGWKQFAYFSGSVGFSYFFGVKERKYKLP